MNRRLFLPFGAAIAAISGLAAAASAPYPAQAVYLCSGHSKGPGDEIMIAEVLTSAQGTPVEFRGTWRPPHTVKSEASLFTVPKLLFGIEYRESAATDGRVYVAPWRYRVAAYLVLPSGKSSGTEQLHRKIASYRLLQVLDDGKPVPVRLESQPYDPNWSGVVEAAAILPAPPAGTQTLGFRLLDPRGKVVSEVAYRIGDTSKRQDLFELGRTEVLKMTAKPEECWKIKR